MRGIIKLGNNYKGNFFFGAAIQKAQLYNLANTRSSVDNFRTVERAIRLERLAQCYVARGNAVCIRVRSRPHSRLYQVRNTSRHPQTLPCVM